LKYPRSPRFETSERRSAAFWLRERGPPSGRGSRAIASARRKSTVVVAKSRIANEGLAQP
jgi:hypothetical protein